MALSEREDVLTNSKSVRGSIFNQFHTGTNSVTGQSGIRPDGQTNFSAEWVVGARRQTAGREGETGIERAADKDGGR